MTYMQVRFCSKVGFFSGLKTGSSNHPQTSRPAFLVNFSGVLQLKNTILGLTGTQYGLSWEYFWLLISGKSISQYASYSAHYIHRIINREQHEKYLYNQSSHYRKYKMHNHLSVCPIAVNLRVGVSLYHVVSLYFIVNQKLYQQK